MCVTDIGIGMTPETAARAFDPFFTTKPLGQGTGLGLSMIYGFVRQSGGHIELVSTAGEGTIAKLYLPRHRGEAEPAKLSAEPSEPPRAKHGETVLLVEDEPAVRMLVLEVLQDLGYNALEAVDAKTAIPIIESEARIDLLISDIGLPGINGRQLADIARRVRSDLKVLFITGYAESDAARSGVLAPGMALVTKPFSTDFLAERIRALIQAS
jgi:CheY-like chemotaxis protein